MILQALGESESLSGALDHSFARRGFAFLHFDSLPDLQVSTILAKTDFNTRRSFGPKSIFSLLAKMLSKNTGMSVPEKNVITRKPPRFPLLLRQTALCAHRRFLRLHRLPRDWRQSTSLWRAAPRPIAATTARHRGTPAFRRRSGRFSILQWSTSTLARLDQHAFPSSHPVVVDNTGRHSS
jgi:hypothetical protein